MGPWPKLYPLTDQNAFICLVDNMGNDSSIVQAARVSCGEDQVAKCQVCDDTGYDCSNWDNFPPECPKCKGKHGVERGKEKERDRNLIRYLLRHSHTTPFEMIEFKFMVQVPIDRWRQWVRHRTGSIHEYSTHYSEALDFFQVTSPQEWRLQTMGNKQGSSGFLGEKDWPEDMDFEEYNDQPYSEAPNYLTHKEQELHSLAKHVYQERLRFGIAKEQARKDLPLSTYTRAYWKCDLHNIFNFLRLRMESHAQLEIRQFANCMFEIVKSVCPVACEAFEDYVLHSKKFSRMEMRVLRRVTEHGWKVEGGHKKPDSMSDPEWKEFMEKLK
jgi:thymidylate synthase (FAD)